MSGLKAVTLTYSELLEHLTQMEEVELLELLQLTSEDLVAKFGDEIDDMSEELFSKFEEEEDDTE